MINTIGLFHNRHEHAKGKVYGVWKPSFSRVVHQDFAQCAREYLACVVGYRRGLDA